MPRDWWFGQGVAMAAGVLLGFEFGSFAAAFAAFFGLAVLVDIREAVSR